MNTTQTASKKTTLKVKKTKTPSPLSQVDSVDFTETPVSSPVDVIETPVLKKKSKKVSAVAETPVSSPVETTDALVSENEAPVSENEAHVSSDEDTWTSSQFLDAINEQRRIVREAEMKVSKLIKKLGVVVRKETRKTKHSKSDKPAVKREQKKRPIIDSLAELMEVPAGSEFSRGDVHAFICKYVKEHELKSADDRKCFELDGRLERVLGKPQYAAHDKNQSLRHSYNNIMKSLKTLFVQEEPEIVA
jgi:chromatin remodeling complex protein RSC6